MIIATIARQGLFRQKSDINFTQVALQARSLEPQRIKNYSNKSDFNFTQILLQARSLEPQRGKD